MLYYFRKKKSAEGVASTLPQYMDGLDALMLRAGDGNSTFVDSSLHGYAITPLVAPRLSFKSPSRGGTSCKFRSAQVDRLAVSVSSDAGFGVGDFTVESSVYLKSYSTTGYITDYRDGSGATATWSEYINSAKKYVINSGYYGVLYTSNRSIPLGSWVHIACVRIAGMIYVFINGRLDGSFANTHDWVMPTENSTMYVGTSSMGGGQTTANTFDGYIAKIHHAKYAKYTEEFTPAEEPYITATSLSTVVLNFATNDYKDLSGNSAVWSNGATRKSSAVKLLTGDSLVFDGTNYVECDPVSLTGDFTISFRVWPTARTTSLAPMISQWKQATGQAGWEVVISTTGMPSFWFGAINESAAIMTSSTAIPLNQATHVAVSRVGTQFLMFQNGVLTASYTAAETVAGRLLDVNVLLGNCIGAAQPPGSTVSYFKGYMDDINICKDYAVYTSPFTVPTDYYAGSGKIRVTGGDPFYAVTPIHLKLNYQNGYIPPTVHDGKGNYLNPSSVVGSDAVSLFDYPTSTYFNGTSALVYSRAHIDIAYGDFTIESDVVFSDRTGLQYLYDTGNGGYGPCLAKNASNLIIYQTNYGNTVITGTTVIATGVRYNIVVERHAGVTRLYINGRMEGAAYNDASLYTGSDGKIGGCLSSSTLGLRGYMSDFRMTLAARYRKKIIPVKSAPFPDYWDFSADDDFSRSLTLNAIDSTLKIGNRTYTNKATGEKLTYTSGNVSQGAVSPFREGYGVYFTTANNYKLPYHDSQDVGAGKFSLEFYGRFDDITTSQYVMTLSNNGLVLTVSAGQLLIYAASTTSSWNILNGIPVIPRLERSKFYRVSIERDESYIYTFVNGTLTSKTATTASIYNAKQGGVTIGGSFAGILSNVRLVKGYCLHNDYFDATFEKLTAVTGTAFLTAQSYNFCDNSINALAVTRTGCVITTTSPIKETYLPGKRKGSIYFDAVGDRLLTASSTRYALGNTYEISFFINPDALPASGNVCRFLMIGTDSQQTSLAISLSNTGVLNVGQASTGAASLSTAAGFIAVGEFTHVCLAMSAGTMTIYKNGKAVMTGTVVPQNAVTSLPLVLGYDTKTGYAGKFNGYLSDFVISKVRRTFADFVPPTSPSGIDGDTVLLLSGDESIIYERNARANVYVTGTVENAYDTRDNGSTYFGGGVSYAKVPYSAQLITPDTGDFTVEMYLNIHTATTAYQSLFSLGNLQLRFGNSGYTAQLQLVNGTTSTYVYSSVYTQTTCLKQWVHVVMQRRNGKMTMHVNGKLTAIGGALYKADTGAMTASDIMLGYLAATGAFTGLLKDIRFSNYARYCGNFVPPARRSAQV